jgi:hypothetical protein
MRSLTILAAEPVDGAEEAEVELRRPAEARVLGPHVGAHRGRRRRVPPAAVSSSAAAAGFIHRAAAIAGGAPVAAAAGRHIGGILLQLMIHSGAAVVQAFPTNPLHPPAADGSTSS